MTGAFTRRGETRTGRGPCGVEGRWEGRRLCPGAAEGVQSVPAALGPAAAWGCSKEGRDGVQGEHGEAGQRGQGLPDGRQELGAGCWSVTQGAETDLQVVT